jgi:hypothetical protein
MATKKKEKTPARTPITCKFTTKDHGRVVFKGLFFNPESGEGEELPQELVKVLEEYGFDQDNWNEWLDITAPTMGLEDNLEYLTNTVPVRISSKLKRNKKGRKRSVFFAALDSTDMCGGKDLYIALTAAHKLWNKKGRPIEGKSFLTAVDTALKAANSKRG